YDEVVGTPIMVRRPAKADSFAASDNRVLEGTEASDGVYPVFLTMTPDSDAVSYNVKAWSTKPASADSQSDASFTDVVPSSSGGMATIRLLYSTPLGEKHWFAVQGVDKLGRVGEWSLLDDGYSAITGDKLVEYMSVFALKPWEHIGKEHFQDYKTKYGTDLDAKWRSSKIYAKIQQAGTGSLSDGITEYSEFNSGTITYVATVQGLGGRVSFTYSSFGELPYLYTNGSFVMVVSMSGSGSCTGAISVGGMYPASIGFDNISVSSQKFVGTYTVVQENGTGAEEIAPL
ncbi:MAG: hypothetical protein SPJ34_02710, partial [Candidatus Ornithospirochaeta sp.]|nr:hypothetical protein [Candidatus Ornithospirochaeta sp.]